MKLSGRISFGILVTLLFISSCAPTEDTDRQSISHRLHSSHVGDEFVITIHLPQSYDTSEQVYPVLVVLDGDKSSGMARDITDWLAWSGEIPEQIVVVISYGASLEEWWNKRSRDLTPTMDSTKLWGEFPLAGGAGAFQSFIRQELIPFVDTNYRTNADRTLAGLSFGGLFGIYVLFSEPSLFHRYIVANPALAWDDERILEYESQYRSKHAALDAVVFTAVGGLDEPAILEPWERFNHLIEAREYEGLKWTAHQFEGESHVSCWPAAFTRGLRTVFAKP